MLAHPLHRIKSGRICALLSSACLSVPCWPPHKLLFCLASLGTQWGFLFFSILLTHFSLAVGVPFPH